MGLREIYIKKPVGAQPLAVQLTSSTVNAVVNALTQHIELESLTVSFHQRKKRRGEEKVLNYVNCISFEDVDEEEFEFLEGQYLVILGEGNWEIMTAADFDKHYGFEDERQVDLLPEIESNA